jgi:hypothetical protein
MRNRAGRDQPHCPLENGHEERVFSRARPTGSNVLNNKPNRKRQRVRLQTTLWPDAVASDPTPILSSMDEHQTLAAVAIREILIANHSHLHQRTM